MYLFLNISLRDKLRLKQISPFMDYYTANIRRSGILRGPRIVNLFLYQTNFIIKLINELIDFRNLLLKIGPIILVIPL